MSSGALRRQCRNGRWTGAPTIPQRSTTLEVTARITTVVIIVSAMSVVPKLKVNTSPPDRSFCILEYSSRINCFKEEIIHSRSPPTIFVLPVCEICTLLVAQTGQFALFLQMDQTGVMVIEADAELLPPTDAIQFFTQAVSAGVSKYKLRIRINF